MDPEYVENLKKIRGLGINPYPYRYKQSHHAAEILDRPGKFKGKKVRVAGRVMSKRGHGKIAFSHLRDQSGDIQLVFMQDIIGPSPMKLYKLLNSGDIIGAEGEVFKTQRGEISIKIKSFELLSKALNPLPSKREGIKDPEIRYRKRYLDMMTTPELREMFIKKAKFWDVIRHFLLKRGFLEVETPILEATAGGADAQPFKTHYKAFDTDVFLRISTGELWQKRLMIAGYEKTFEIGRQFRNEGISPEHLQDYTQMEFYWAFADYEDGMKLVEELYKHIAKEVFGTLKFKIRGFNVDFGKKWKRIDYVSEIKEQKKIDVLKATKKELQAKLKALKIPFEKNLERGRLIDLLWKQCRKNIGGPAFLIHPPIEVSPLAKRYRRNPRLAERFWPLIAGSEIGNGYTELNDPMDQEKRFREQAKLRELGDLEAQMHDKDFVEALTYAMPPTCGFGVSERLFSFLMNKPIRECVLFPFVKPEASKEGKK